MVPSPGESPGDWWANTGWEQAKREQAQREGRDDTDDPVALFLHDLPPDVKAAAMTKARNQSGTPFEKPWPLVGVARRADGVPALPRRPLLPRRVPAAGRRRTSGHHARRDGRRPPARARTPGRAGRTTRGLSDRARDRERSDTMTRTEPTEAIDARYSSEGAAATPWDEARRQLEEAGVYWITTVRPDGRPHVTTLIAVWVDDALYFCTGAEERKAKNLAQNPHCILTTGCNTLRRGSRRRRRERRGERARRRAAPTHRRRVRDEVRERLALRRARRHVPPRRRRGAGLRGRARRRRSASARASRSARPAGASPRTSPGDSSRPAPEFVAQTGHWMSGITRRMDPWIR